MIPEAGCHPAVFTLAQRSFRRGNSTSRRHHACLRYGTAEYWRRLAIVLLY